METISIEMKELNQPIARKEEKLTKQSTPVE